MPGQSAAQTVALGRRSSRPAGQHVFAVPQSTVLFSGTVRDKLAMAHPHAGFEDGAPRAGLQSATTPVATIFFDGKKSPWECI